MAEFRRLARQARTTADLLTAARVGIAPVLGIVVAAGYMTAGAVLLSAAWLSDFFDGRAARRAGGGTRLGRFDLAADTLVGACLVVGLVAGRHVPPWVLLPAAILSAGFFLGGNEACGMLLQAVGYGPFLWLLWHDAAPWIPVATAVLIWTLDWRRFWTVVLPQFFAGVGAIRPVRRSRRSPSR